VQEPAWYHAECNDPDYSRFTQEKDEAFSIVSDKGGYVTPLYTTSPAQPAPVQSLPFGVGGGLVAIKTLLSRDPCVHANTAIEMIDAILKNTPPAAQRQWVGLTEQERNKIRFDYLDYDERARAIEAKLKKKNT
jgi:hypothetical protein